MTIWPLPSTGATVAADADATPGTRPETTTTIPARRAKNTCLSSLGSDISARPLSAPFKERAGKMNRTVRGDPRDEHRARADRWVPPTHLAEHSDAENALRDALGGPTYPRALYAHPLGHPSQSDSFYQRAP